MTDSQLRDLQPGDRVSRYSRPGEVQTAPVARLTDTLIVVLWPDETEARYWRESGTRTNCRGEALRMPDEEPEPGGYPPCTLDSPGCQGGPGCPAWDTKRSREEAAVAGDIVEQLLTAAAVDGKREPIVYDDGLWDAAGDDRPSDEERAWLRSLADTYHSLPLADAIRRWREHRTAREDGAIAKSPSAPPTPPNTPPLPVELLTLSTPCPVFYAALGPFLGRFVESVSITQQPGKTWVVALVDGLPVGCGAVFLPEGDQAELASAYVLPEYRHQGVYRRLLLARTELATAAGKTRIVATCTPASRAILARLGFIAISESAGYTTMSLAAR